MSNKSVCGVGINDAVYVVKIRGNYYTPEGKRKRPVIWACPYYTKWTLMLQRCYSEVFLTKHPTYRGCFVAEEWLRFSNFRAWMVSEERELSLKGLTLATSTLHLDKDISFKGNKEYSASRCKLVHGTLNRFLVNCGAKRGKWPLGVSDITNSRVLTFRANCKNPLGERSDTSYIGCFSCPYEAHYAWQARKHKYAIKLANSEYVTDERVRQKLLTMYAPDTDHLEGWVWDEESNK